MVKLKRFLKTYREAGAFHSLLGPHRFIDDQVFLTKGNALGVMIAVDGIDPECLTAETLETYTRRIATAWRSFDDRFRLYQYFVKQSKASVPFHGNYASTTVERTVRSRVEYLQTKSNGLYSVQIYYVILFEPSPLRTTTLFNRKAIRHLAAQLERSRDTLMGYVEAFRRNIGDLLGLTILDKRAAFAFFRLLVNLEPGVAAAERLKYDSHVDYFLPSLALACTEDGVRVGDTDLEVLSLREPPASTYPNLLRDLVALESDFILCSEFKRVLNDSAITTIRTAQNHFHWSQWVADIPSIVSMVLNRGKRENVIADKTALNDVEDLDKTLARIKNDGEYLGEFSFTAIIYTRGDSGKRQSPPRQILRSFWQSRSFPDSREL